MSNISSSSSSTSSITSSYSSSPSLSRTSILFHQNFFLFQKFLTKNEIYNVIKCTRESYQFKTLIMELYCEIINNYEELVYILNNYSEMRVISIWNSSNFTSSMITQIFDDKHNLISIKLRKFNVIEFNHGIVLNNINNNYNKKLNILDLSNSLCKGDYIEQVCSTFFKCYNNNLKHLILDSSLRLTDNNIYQLLNIFNKLEILSIKKVFSLQNLILAGLSSDITNISYVCEIKELLLDKCSRLSNIILPEHLSCPLFTNISIINLDNTSITSNIIEKITGSCCYLKKLSMRCCLNIDILNITTKTLTYINMEGCGNCTSLSINCINLITIHLLQCYKLEELNISSKYMKCLNLNMLQSLTNLTLDCMNLNYIDYIGCIKLQQNSNDLNKQSNNNINSTIMIEKLKKGCPLIDFSSLSISNCNESLNRHDSI